MQITKIDPEVQPSPEQLRLIGALDDVGWEEEVLVGDDGKTLLTHFYIIEYEQWLISIEWESEDIVSCGTIDGFHILDASLFEFAKALKDKLEHLSEVRKRLEAEAKKRSADDLPLAN